MVIIKKTKDQSKTHRLEIIPIITMFGSVAQENENFEKLYQHDSNGLATHKSLFCIAFEGK